jgi:hypothetical protein
MMTNLEASQLVNQPYRYDRQRKTQNARPITRMLGTMFGSRILASTAVIELFHEVARQIFTSHQLESNPMRRT